MDFAPTALLVMTHNVTGMKYFCKTTRLKNLHWYKGSGLYDDGMVFESVAAAGRACNGTTSGITQCCLGTAKSAHGFRWAYKE